MVDRRRLRRTESTRAYGGAFDRRPTCTSTGTGRAGRISTCAREFELFLERFIRSEVNYLSWVLHTYGRLHQESTGIDGILPDSTTLTDFACEACGKPLVHHLKHGEQGYDFFGCSGCLDGCVVLYDRKDGKPIREA